MTRRRLALLLAALVAASGVLPLLLLAVFGLEILRKRGEQASQESLHAIAEQAAARIATSGTASHGVPIEQSTTPPGNASACRSSARSRSYGYGGGTKPTAGSATMTTRA